MRGLQRPDLTPETGNHCSSSPGGAGTPGGSASAEGWSQVLSRISTP